MVDEIDPVYDEITVTDAFGQSVRRWGYYQDGLERKMSNLGPLKRKASSEIQVTPKKSWERKLSMGEFVNADRLTASMERFPDEAQDAVDGEAADKSEWE